MRIALAGPYRDAAGKTCDEDLHRVILSRHRATLGHSEIVVGHCRPSDGSVLIFGHVALNSREQAEAKKWARELVRELQEQGPDGK